MDNLDQNPYFHLKQVIIDFQGCELSENEFNSPEFFINVAENAVKLANTTTIKKIDHEFDPNGYTLTLILADSSLTIHTWPEEKFITLDFFTCSEKSNPSDTIKYLVSEFKAKKHKVYDITRS